MTTSRLRPPVVLAVASLMLTAPLAAQQPDGEVLQANRQYAAGTRVAAPWTGVSFVVPEAFAGAFDAEVAAFVMKSASNTEAMLGVFAYSEASVDEAVGAVEQRLIENGVRLRPRPNPTRHAAGISGWYDFLSPQGQGVIYGSAKRDPAGNVVVVLGLGTSTQESALQPLVDGLMASVRFSPPGAAQWRSMAAGKAYVAGSSGSDFSPGGGGTASGASQSQAQLDLCSDGSYGYQSRSETYISVEGAGGASSESSDQHMGRWWLVADISGAATLVLESTDGRAFLWSVVERGNGVEIDGQAHSVSPSRRCR